MRASTSAGPPLVAGGRLAPGWLPASRTAVIGRHAELEQIRGAMSAGRLTTVTGVPGVGKTLLALTVAAGVQAAGTRVRLAALDRLEDPGQLHQVLAVAADGCGRAGAETVPMLLVLDNAEHLNEDVAAMADELLRATPDLRILATSRHSLAIEDERLVEIQPLPLPDPDQPPHDEPDRDPALALFAARARSVRTGWQITPDNAAAVARICRRLDGLPLAIEMAAARLRVMSIAQLEDALDGDRFAVLARRQVGAPPRHLTVWALVDWSWRLCSAAERLLWTRLSASTGAIDLEAARRVCAGDWSPRRVDGLLASLVDKSVLIAQDAGQVVSYRLLETVREYGARRLAESGVVHSLASLAWIAAADDPTRAATILGALQRAEHESGLGMGPALLHRQDQAATDARTALGEDRYQAALTAGRRLSLDAAVDVAMRREPAEGTPSAVSSRLTARQQEVAELVAAGWSNRQIAARLGISLRTADAHVAQILRRLGLTSRTQVAPWISHHAATGG